MQEPLAGKLPFYARLALVLISVVSIAFILYEAQRIFIPVFFSVLLTFLLLPAVRWLERHKVPRALAPIPCILLLIAGLGSVLYFVILQLISFLHDLPVLGAKLHDWALQLQAWAAKNYGINLGDEEAMLRNITGELATTAKLMVQAIGLGSIGVLVLTLFIFIFTYFMLYHRRLLRRFVIALFQTEHKYRVEEVMNETRLLSNKYVTGLLLEMVCIGVLNGAGFLIFGIKYALLLALLACFLNMIPYIGIATSCSIAALVTLTNSTPTAAITAVAILLVVHFIDANIILPRIVGARVKMNPLMTIVAVLTGSLLWGVAGMFLFVPLAAMLKIVFERVRGLQPWAILMGTEDEVPLN